MTSSFTGSNYGVISSLNSLSGVLTTGNSISGSYESSQNYTSASILYNITTNGLAIINIYYSNDNIGTNYLIESFKIVKVGSDIINFTPQGKFIKIELVNQSSGNINYSLQTRFNNTSTISPSQTVLSTNNSFILNSTVSASSTIYGSYEEILDYSLITVLINGSAGTSPASGLIKCYFSGDGTNTDRIVNYPVQDVTASDTTSTSSLTFNPAHTLLPISKYFKIDYVNGTVNLTSLRVSVVYHIGTSKALTSRATQFLTDYYDTDTSRCIINGRTEGTLLPGGHYQNINASNGRLNVRIQEPLTSFGEVMNAELTPFTQFDFTNGKPLDQIVIYQNYTSSTSYSFANSTSRITNTSTSNLSKIELKGNLYTKYKPGQGCDNRFTARFPSGYVTNVNQYAGIFTEQDSAEFGYFNGSTEFAIRYQTFGQQQKDRITINADASSTYTLQITFNAGVTYGTTVISVSIVSGDTPLIIANKIYTSIMAVVNPPPCTYGFIVEYYYTTVKTTYYVDLIYNISTNTAVTITTSPTPANISISNINTGISPTTTIITQSNWNLNTCKDMGSLQQNYLLNSTGFILDPTKGNVYKISFQYLGYGAITFYIEQSESETLLAVHKIRYTNSNTQPSFRNPSMRIGIGIDRLGSSSDVSVESVSMATFLQGKFKPSPIYREYGKINTGNTNSLNTITRDNPVILFGLIGTNIYESLNSSGTNYVFNTTNLYFSTLNVMVNSTSNGNTNIIFLLIKNPISITVRPTGTYADIQKDNNKLIDILNGVPITSSTTGYLCNGGEIVLGIPAVDNISIPQNILDLGIYMTPTDSYYLCYYGSINGTGSPTADIGGSLTYYINM